MTTSPISERVPGTRDATRSRQAILDAAADVFSQKGYAATTIREISVRAGVSSGTPGYFFGSKLGIYRALFDRLLERVAGRARTIRARCDTTPPERLAREFVAMYVDTPPQYARLFAWEALSGVLDLRDYQPYKEAIGEVKATIEALVQHGALVDVDPAFLVLDLVGQSWLPGQRDILFGAIGLKSDDRAFLAAYKGHVTSLFFHPPSTATATATDGLASRAILSRAVRPAVAPEHRRQRQLTVLTRGHAVHRVSRVDYPDVEKMYSRFLLAQQRLEAMYKHLGQMEMPGPKATDLHQSVPEPEPSLPVDSEE